MILKIYSCHKLFKIHRHRDDFQDVTVYWIEGFSSNIGDRDCESHKQSLLGLSFVRINVQNTHRLSRWKIPILRKSASCGHYQYLFNLGDKVNQPPLIDNLDKKSDSHTNQLFSREGNSS